MVRSPGARGSIGAGRHSGRSFVSRWSDVAIAFLCLFSFGALAIAPTAAQAATGTLTWGAPFSLTSQVDGRSVACRATAECVAVGDLAYVETSTDPAGGSTAWSIKSVVPTDAPTTHPNLYAVACPSKDWCIAGGVSDYLSILTTPFSASPSSWPASRLLPAANDSIRSISCPSTTFCAAVTSGNEVFTSSTPQKLKSWKAINISTGYDGSTNGISCPSTSLCVVSAEFGIFSSPDPGAASPAWGFVNTGAGYGPSSVACPDNTHCVVGTSEGYILSSTDPTGPKSEWTGFANPVGTSVTAVTCASDSFCLATDYVHYAYTSTTPMTGNWTSAEVDPSSDEPFSASCPTITLCVVTGSDWIVGTLVVEPLAITPTSLPPAVIGTAYSQTLTATGGNPGYTWKVAKGSKLPAGLKLGKTTGTIAGTPTARSTTSTFEVEVQDTKTGTPKTRNTAIATFTITVT